MTTTIAVYHVPTQCPVCNADLVSLRFGRKHIVNEKKSESAYYECGASIEYSANLQKLETLIDCPKSKETIQQNKRINKILNPIITILDKEKLNPKITKYERNLYDKISSRLKNKDFYLF